MEKAIIVEELTKKYKLYNNTKERILDLASPRNYGEDFYALTNINFEASHGEVIGFIGINGSGKSTLSNIIAGIVPETSGSVKVNGEVSLIAVSAGLKNDLSGRDNIELKLLMLGFNKDEIKLLEDDIIEFSELESFIDQPVKSYSSGMKSRLGFAISVNVNPDILIIDEALSVGDKAFAEKSLKKMQEFKQEGKTMIFVSHSIGQMKKFCEKILWLEYGMVKDYGTVEEIIPKYEEFLNKWQKLDNEGRKNYKKLAIENQRRIITGKNIKNKLEINDFYTKKVVEDKCEVRPISALGHIRARESYIYRTPKNLSLKESSNKFKKAVYYIKRQATYNDQLFYLLSDEPSAVHNTLGWMKANDVSVHYHTFVDNDAKTFLLTGAGKAYNKPWGGEKNCIYDDLSEFKNKDFKVSQTDLVGNNVWYKGTLNNYNIWIHEHFLYTE